MSEPKSCFVIMPISTPIETVPDYGGDAGHFKHVLDHLIKPAVAAEGYTVIPPMIENSEIIQGEIIRHLATADLVLCDITGWNANVFFELGIRVALDRPVALIRDDLTETIPFDNNMVSCHSYAARIELWNIDAEVQRLRRHIKSAGSQERNAMWKYFGIAQVASMQNSANPVEAKLDLVLSELSTRFPSNSPPPTPTTGWYEPPRPVASQGRVRERKSIPVDERKEIIEDELRSRFRAINPNIRVMVIESILSEEFYNLIVNTTTLSEAEKARVRDLAEELVANENVVGDVTLTTD